MNNGIIEQMQAEIAELKAKVAAMEGANKPKGNTYTLEVLLKTPQQRRDEIIEKAKRDVAELKERALQGTQFDTPSTKKAGALRISFNIASEKRVVVALAFHANLNTRRPRFKGIAKCDPSDCFNVHIGKAIALRRALGLEIPAEYYNAPAPTEVRVGDKVRVYYVEGYRPGGREYFEDVIVAVDDDSYGLPNGEYTSFDPKEDRVIDDSRE